ncbi:MAG: cation-translocating P-type ATPase [Burkholderiales bacterium]|nr:cation-translocating P-type ATPase [Burkholderiales bacterium]
MSEPAATVAPDGACAPAAPTPATEVVLAVEGIHCASCVQLIEMQVAAVPGVAAVDVGLASHRARVRFDPARADLAGITAAIARVGYRAWPVLAAGASRERARARRMALWRLFVAGFSMMQVMMYATPAYLAIEGEMEADIAKLLNIASFVLTVPVIFYSAAPLFANAWRDLRLRRVGMDVPASLGLLVTFLASAWNTFVDSGPVYYDSVAMFVFFLLGARHLEQAARERSGAAVEELARLQPARANLLPDWPRSMRAHEVAAADLAPGDRVLVRAGEAVPADGRVCEGRSLNDEALISGESRPAAKAPGSAVTGGAVNLVAPLVVEVGAAAADSRLAQVVRLVDAAANAKPHWTLVADRYAARFLWAILALALAAAAGWSLADPARALPAAVAILIVTCPCALSLAAPLAFSAAIGNLATRGMLTVRGHALEALAGATHMVFDKTGTLTTGRMRVAGVDCAPGAGEAYLLALAARLESVAVHPVAQAIAMAAAPHAQLAQHHAIAQAREVPGAGVEAHVDGVPYRVGSPAFVAQLAGPAPAALLRHGGSRTLAAVGSAAGWLGVIGLEDGVRPGARALVAALDAAGVAVSLASGDRAPAVAAAAQTLGVEQAQAGMSPDAKRAYVASLQAAGASVAMVGDGVNDAPVLALAQVSIAIGSGAPLAQTRADMVLMSGAPADLAHAVDTARRTVRVVRQNIAWAALYNLIAIPLAASGAMTPWMAGLGMAASSLIVVANSLRLMPSRRARGPAAAAPSAALPAAA